VLPLSRWPAATPRPTRAPSFASAATADADDAKDQADPGLANFANADTMSAKKVFRPAGWGSSTPRQRSRSPRPPPLPWEHDDADPVDSMSQALAVYGGGPDEVTLQSENLGGLDEVTPQSGKGTDQVADDGVGDEGKLLRDFVGRFDLDARSAGFVNGLPCEVRSTVVENFEPAVEALGYEVGGVWDQLFRFVRSVWARWLYLDREALRRFKAQPEDAQRVIITKFDPSCTKDGNVAARLRSFTASVVTTGTYELGRPYISVVPDFSVPVSARPRIIGDRGSNVRQVVEVICDCIGHDPTKHGRVPFVQFIDRNGWLEFEIELYVPFNNKDSFDLASGALRQMVQEIMDDPTLMSPKTRHCRRPSKVQIDDWDCPNRDCGNLCFAKRWSCPLCGAPKPKDWKPASISSEPLVRSHNRNPVTMVTTKDRLGPPTPGHCQVVWLVPVGNRGYVMGKQGSTVHWITSSCGIESLNLTREVENRTVGGEMFCMAFVRGPPVGTRMAVEMIYRQGGGRLAQDGFGRLLSAVRSALQAPDSDRAPWRKTSQMSIWELMQTHKVEQAWSSHDIRNIVYGAGLVTLEEVLQQWPELFKVHCGIGPDGGAAVELA